MPTIPERLSITNVSADVINAIRNSGSINYRDYIPVTTQDADSIRHVGSIIMDSPNLRNAFAADLLNMVIAVHVASKSYESPTARLKKGLLEHGETIEDVFINMLEAEIYDPGTAEAEVFKRRFPDIRVAYYVTNYQVFYPVSISNEQLRAAFYTADGVYNLIMKIEEQLYTADAYDDFNMVKYMVASAAVSGRIKAVTVPAATSDANIRSTVRTIKATSNRMRFMTAEYTLAGVKTHAQHPEQTLLISADFDAAVDVEVLAAAFNMSKAEFLSKRLLVDSFGAIDKARLAAVAPELCDSIVYETLPNGIKRVISADLKHITDEQLAALDALPAVLIDDEWVQEYDVLNTMEEIRNPQGLYTNAFYHVWRKYAISPFAPAALFDATASAGVTGITVTPETAAAVPGTSLQLSATVTATGFVDGSVNWAVERNTAPDTVIDAAGNLHISADESASSLVVSATSNADDSVTATARIIIVGTPNVITIEGDYTMVADPNPAYPGFGVVVRSDNSGASGDIADYDITVTDANGNNISFTAKLLERDIIHVSFVMPNSPVTITVTDI